MSDRYIKNGSYPYILSDTPTPTFPILPFDETKDFFIKKIGQSIVLTPIEDSCWSGVFDAIENFKGEIEREQPKLEERTFE